MGAYSDIHIGLCAVNEHEQALWAQLKAAETTLTALFHNRENVIKTKMGGSWDAEQYQLDDMQQNLGNVIELFRQIQPFTSALNK
jgi:hypothetical protein